MDFFLNRIKLFKNRFRKRLRSHVKKEKAYLKKLLFPLKLFPLKLIVYFFYYPIRITSKILLWFIKLIIKAVTYPFKSFSNFFKAAALLALLGYIFFSMVAIADYIRRNYGDYSKFFCGGAASEREIKGKVVRILGEFAEGSGFFIDKNKVITNFHVIEGEPSPKIVLPGGNILTPVKITSSNNYDLAVIEVDRKIKDMVLPVMNPLRFYSNEPVLSVGYALGTDLLGEPTLLKGRFVSFRELSGGYIQTDINLVPGMSGGPLLDQCGEVVGINTMGLSGLSLFIPAYEIYNYPQDFNNEDIARIKVDTQTPQGAVRGFYTFIKARDLESAFNLLSDERRSTISSFDEWTKGYANTLHVSLVDSRVDEYDENLVEIKLSSKDWIGDRLVYKYFQGTWIVVEDEGEYKLDESNIKQLDTKPPRGWWYYWDDE